MPPELQVDEEALPAITAGLHLAAVEFVRVLSVPGGEDLLARLRAKIRAKAQQLEPPEEASGELRERWVELAILAIDHVFDHAGLEAEH